MIGGGAGAFPPLIGWVAVTGDVTILPIILFAIIFLWTPPHSWALALFARSDYTKVGIPMMAVVAGDAVTRRLILAYSALLLPVTLLPCAFPGQEGGFGIVYGLAAFTLSLSFLGLASRVGLRAHRDDRMKPERQLFTFSIFYLFALFAALVADRRLG